MTTDTHSTLSGGGTIEKGELKTTRPVPGQFKLTVTWGSEKPPLAQQEFVLSVVHNALNLLEEIPRGTIEKILIDPFHG